MNALTNEIYQSQKVLGVDGSVHKLHSAVDLEEGRFIEKIIAQDGAIAKTLEIGCAFGLSSLIICNSIKSRTDAHHTIVDPFQYSQWDGIGIENLKRSDIKFFSHIEEKSEFALPMLLKGGEGVFDLIFIDGFHTFDHTMIDCFYAMRLLKVSGYLLIDDVNLIAVRRVVDYLLSYPCAKLYAQCGSRLRISFKRRIATTLLKVVARGGQRVLHPGVRRKILGSYDTRMIAIKKVAEDARPWDWYPEDF